MGNKQNKGAPKKANKKNEDNKRSKSAEPFNESSSHNNFAADNNKPSTHSHKSSINNLNRSAVTPPPRSKENSVYLKKG